MLPALASVVQLEARLGLDANTLADADLDRARAALHDASTLVRSEARQSWVDEAGAITAPDVVIRVALGAARRTFTNPDAAISDTAGPFARRLRDDDTGVYLTKAEVDIVRRFRASGSGGLWTLQTERDGDFCETIWYRPSVGTEWFPLASNDDIAWPT